MELKGYVRVLGCPLHLWVADKVFDVQPLFRSRDMHVLKEEIEAANVGELLSPIQDYKLRALISKLLVKDPVERLSLLDIHEDEFFDGL